MMEDKTPIYRKVIAGVIVIVAIVAVIIWQHRVVTDVWPLDNSTVGPNLLAALIQGAVVLIVVVLIWPPTRRRLHLFMDRKIDTVQSSLVKLHREAKEHSDLLHQESTVNRATLEAKLDHVIKYHPDIPEFGEQATPQPVKKAPAKKVAAKKAPVKKAPAKKLV